MKRDKIVAVSFIVAMILIPMATLIGNFMTKVENTALLEQQNAILEGNGTIHDDQQDSQVEEEVDDEIILDGAIEQNWFDKVRQNMNLFTDKLSVKEKMIVFNIALSQFLSGDSNIQSTQVLLGKNQWLFYKTELDGHPMDDYKGSNHFTEEELHAVAQNLVDNRNYFQNEYGIRMVYMEVPNKESVYAEYMPDTIYRISNETRADQVAAYIADNTDLEFVYPKKELIEAKKKAQVYYATDTHWNQIGAFVGLQALFQEMYGSYRDIDTVQFVFDKTDYAGDLAMIIRAQDKYNFDTIYVLDRGSVDEEQKRDNTVLIVGDSFSGFLSIEAEAYYDHVIWTHVVNFHMSMIEEYHPDTIIWECTERYIENFKDINLQNQY